MQILQPQSFSWGGGSFCCFSLLNHHIISSLLFICLLIVFILFQNPIWLTLYYIKLLIYYWSFKIWLCKELYLGSPCCRGTSSCCWCFFKTILEHCELKCDVSSFIYLKSHLIICGYFICIYNSFAIIMLYFAVFA